MIAENLHAFEWYETRERPDTHPLRRIENIEVGTQCRRVRAHILERRSFEYVRKVPFRGTADE